MIYAYAQEVCNGGELSPRMWGRVSSDRYKAGFAICENFIPTPHGPVVKRGGTRFVKEVKASANATIVVPFIMGNGVKVILEFGNLYVRFYKDKAPLVSGSHVELVSPYTSAQLANLSFAADADRLYIAHPNVAPYELVYTSLSSWALSVMSFTATPASWTGANWPALVFLYEQRLGFARTPSDPHKYWLSKPGAKTNMTGGTSDDDAIIVSLPDGAGFSWFAPGDKLLYGTNLNEGKIVSDSAFSPLTPTDCYTRPQTFHGSALIAPVRMDTDVLFLQRGARKLRRLGYRLDKDAYSGEDVSLPSEHITVGGLGGLAYINEPDGIVYANRGDGQLVGITYEPGAAVSSWHRHDVGGVVESVAGMHGTDAYKDELWMVVKRTIGGSVKRYIEYLVPGLTDDADVVDACFVDCAMTVDLGSGGDTTVTGATHLAGETVTIWSDGFQQPPVAVDEYGEFELQTNARYVTFGLPFTAKLKTLPIEAGSRIGMAQGKIKRISKVMLRLYRTLGLSVWDADETYEEEYHFGPATVAGEGVALFTGDTEAIDVPQGYTPEGQLVITHSHPTPCCISLIAYGGHTGD